MVSYWIKIAGSSAHYSHCFWQAGGGYLGTWHLIITLSIVFHFVFSSWKKLRWLINRPVDALKVLRYWHCSVSHSWAHDNKIGLVWFHYVTLRAGLEIMTRWAFALFFLWNVKVGMRVLILNVSMFWEALLTFYGVVIGNGKMALYIYILYI